MLRKLIVGNFKAVGQKPVELDLRPLTLLVGENGTGKSSVLEGLALLAQSVRPALKFGMETDGPLVTEDSTIAPLHYAGRVDQPIVLGVGWGHGDDMRQATWEVRQEGTTGRGTWAQKLESPRSGASITFAGRSHEGEASAVSQDPWNGKVRGNPARFLDEALFIPAAPGAEATPPAALAHWAKEADELAALLQRDRVRFISALRGAALMSPDPKTREHRHGQNTKSLLSSLLGRGSRTQQALLSRLATRFGMDRLAAYVEGEKLLEVAFDDPHTGTRVSLDYAGFGSQQALPVLVNVTEAEPGSVLMIEEVEHSCHPRWVAAWGETLAEVVKERGIQVIATTHAPDLVLAVCLSIQRGVIPASDVAIHQFARDREGARAVHVPIGPHGLLERGWIDSFARAERELLGALMMPDDAGVSDAPPSSEQR